MKWIDYREKLGIGFDDNQKLIGLKSKISGLLDSLAKLKANGQIKLDSFKSYYMMIGEIPYNSYYRDFDRVFHSIDREKDILSVVSKWVAFINTARESFAPQTVSEFIKMKSLLFLEELNIQYELIIDDDGIFIFPKGVPEFDDALVSAPLDWLKDYPNAEKAWSKALRGYAEVKQENASDVADLFRKALEAFFQEAFGGGKSLENYKSEYGSFLKANGVPQEIANNFVTLMDAFTKYNNNYAKHHDKVELNILEYLMYQTGNIIRLIITLKQEEAQ